MVCEQALQAGLEIRFGVAPFAEHIFSRLQRSSALKSVPGFRFAPPQALVRRAFGAEDHRFLKLDDMSRQQTALAVNCRLL